jgi:hypothetical protein
MNFIIEGFIKVRENLNSCNFVNWKKDRLEIPTNKF